LFLLGVAVGVTGSVGLAITAVGTWAFEVGLMGLASAWLVTTFMAYYSIRRGLVALHKEWMIRAYVVTFAFVFFRVLSDYTPMAGMRPENERDITIAWACWVCRSLSPRWCFKSGESDLPSPRANRRRYFSRAPFYQSACAS
jgi:Predicted membrane protein (DUF2306)